jgi:hypothetical protein
VAVVPQVVQEGDNCSFNITLNILF